MTKEIDRPHGDQHDSFEIPVVSEELYNRTREALIGLGFTFVVAVEPVSVGQLRGRSIGTGKEAKPFFTHVDSSETMLSHVPPQMEIAINLNQRRIEGSNSKSADVQMEMIKTWGKTLKRKLPKELRDLVSVIVPHASVLAQIDYDYQKETGEVFFTNWDGRTNDQTDSAISDSVAWVGRAMPSNPLSVISWFKDYKDSGVFAVPIVVLPRKLAA